MSTKGDLINSAYSKGRISGLTSQPTPEDIALGLEVLEDMAAQWSELNICTGFFFEDTPDANSPHNLPRKYRGAYISNLAVRLLTNFGKQPMPYLMVEYAKDFSFMSASTAQPQRVNYPNRMPVGSGNSSRYNTWRRFNPTIVETPYSCETNKMLIGDINDFIEHFDSYLKLGETIASYTLTADDGLTVVSESLVSPDVNYRIEATGSDTTSNEFLTVTIVATTSAGRIETRIINFELIQVD